MPSPSECVSVNLEIGSVTNPYEIFFSEIKPTRGVFYGNQPFIEVKMHFLRVTL